MLYLKSVCEFPDIKISLEKDLLPMTQIFRRWAGGRGTESEKADRAHYTVLPLGKTMHMQIELEEGRLSLVRLGEDEILVEGQGLIERHADPFYLKEGDRLFFRIHRADQEKQDFLNKLYEFETRRWRKKQKALQKMERHMEGELTRMHLIQEKLRKKGWPEGKQSSFNKLRTSTLKKYRQNLAQRKRMRLEVEGLAESKASLLEDLELASGLRTGFFHAYTVSVQYTLLNTLRPREFPPLPSPLDVDAAESLLGFTSEFGSVLTAAEKLSGIKLSAESPLLKRYLLTFPQSKRKELKSFLKDRYKSLDECLHMQIQGQPFIWPFHLEFSDRHFLRWRKKDLFETKRRETFPNLRKQWLFEKKGTLLLGYFVKVQMGTAYLLKNGKEVKWMHESGYFHMLKRQGKSLDAILSSLKSRFSNVRGGDTLTNFFRHWIAQSLRVQPFGLTVPPTFKLWSNEPGQIVSVRIQTDGLTREGQINSRLSRKAMRECAFKVYLNGSGISEDPVDICEWGAKFRLKFESYEQEIVLPKGILSLCPLRVKRQKKWVKYLLEKIQTGSVVESQFPRDAYPDRTYREDSLTFRFTNEYEIWLNKWWVVGEDLLRDLRRKANVKYAFLKEFAWMNPRPTKSLVDSWRMEMYVEEEERLIEEALPDVDFFEEDLGEEEDLDDEWGLRQSEDRHFERAKDYLNGCLAALEFNMR